MPGMTRRRPTFSRRSFLQYTGLTTGLLTLSHLRPALVLATPGDTAGALVLTPHDAEILTAVVTRMVFTGTNDQPPVTETGAIETIDRALSQLEASVQSQLRWLLTAVQWGPLLFEFKLKTFTALSAEDQDRHLRDWATSRWQTRRLAFRALKNLSMLGYYSQDATWKAIHYDGPWAPRPRRLVSADT